MSFKIYVIAKKKKSFKLTFCCYPGIKDIKKIEIIETKKTRYNKK
jgi:hypothetical protein